MELQNTAQQIPEALTFDDVLLVPQASAVLPTTVETATPVGREFTLQVPLISAAMDTVTDARMAIAMAQVGGLGIIHKNMSIEEEAAAVARVKKFESGRVVQPVTLGPDEPVSHAMEMQRQHQITGFPIVDRQGILVGILTNRDIRAAGDPARPIHTAMTPRSALVTAEESVTIEEATRLMHERRVEKLPILHRDGRLHGLITLKDLQMRRTYPKASKDPASRLCVGAAVGVGGSAVERAAALIEAGVDLLCIDTAHGHSTHVMETVRTVRQRWTTVAVMAGNVSTAEGVAALCDAGATAVKVGQGPGSICTTRIVSGCGMPQLSAILDCAPVTRARGVTLVADGGIKFSGDIVKALAAGADAVMIGSLLAGTDEAPGEVILYQGRRYKIYRGMGSISAMMDGGRDRYGQGDITDTAKLVPEGIEGRVPYRGRVADTVFQLVGGVRSGMGYVGAASLAELRARARFVRIGSAGLRESHVHDVMITKEAPNYSIE
ncbi:MAG: IMP dehydrogenase [Deltaproteobacteria bacterium]|nr:IMP dehydrogenase [Deltaproteobacteria bacterium]